jgi:hypothetical protein
MYCPNCGSQNAEGTKFCRTCGANLSLVPQALTGQLPPEDRYSRRRRKRHGDGRPPNLGHGITQTFTGLGFLFVALSISLFFPGGKFWWFWMLIPAFAMLGKGVAEIVSARTAWQQSHGNQTTANMPPRRQTGELPPEPPGFTLPPPSVTEDTTRHLDPNKDRYPQRR